MTRKMFQMLLVALAAASFATSAQAVPTVVTAVDDPLCCDVLTVPTNVHELGIGVAAMPFPPNEHISASDQLISTFACPSNAVAGIASTANSANTRHALPRRAS